MEKVRFLNTYINNLTMGEAVSSIESLIECKNKSYVLPIINTDVVVKIENDEYLKHIVDNSDITLIDGKPLVWIAKLKNIPIYAKISGSDLVIELLKLSDKNGYSIFIIGGKDGVAEKAKRNILNKYRGIPYVDVYCPPFGFENNQAEIDKINEIINKSEYDILISCLGCPKQEKWVYENYKNYNAIVSICAGATVDFLAGNVKRAPKWISNVGFEWFYRFLQEPKRLFKRYFIDDLKILKIIRKYK